MTAHCTLGVELQEIHHMFISNLSVFADYVGNMICPQASGSKGDIRTSLNTLEALFAQRLRHSQIILIHTWRQKIQCQNTLQCLLNMVLSVSLYTWYKTLKIQNEEGYPEKPSDTSSRCKIILLQRESSYPRLPIRLLEH